MVAYYSSKGERVENEEDGTQHQALRDTLCDWGGMRTATIDGDVM